MLMRKPPKLIGTAFFVAVTFLSFPPEAIAKSPTVVNATKVAANACIPCTTRCAQCSGSTQCHDACMRNGNPSVKAKSACGKWYEPCK